MTLQFKVVHQIIHPANRDPYAQEVVSDSIGYLHTQFTFDPEWDGLIKSAVFLGANGLAYRIPLDLSGLCLVPHEVIKAPYLKITVIGSNLEDEVYSLPTAPYQLKIKQSGAKDGEIPEDPTPETYAIVMDIMRQQAVEAVAALEAQAAAELARDETVDILENITDEIVPAITEDADRSEAKADLSTTQATKSESYAVGGTASREGEDTDNALYYKGLAESAKTAAETAQGLAEDAQEDAEAAATETVEAASLLLSGYVTDAQTAKTGAETAQGLAEAAKVAAEQVVIDTKTKVAENTSNIKAIEETMINYNPTAETRLTQTTADRVVSLPKNAGEGGLKSVINGMTLNNLVTNGNFANGTTGWSKTAATTIVEESGRLKITAGSAGDRAYQTITTIVGHKYYVKATIEGNTTKNISFNSVFSDLTAEGTQTLSLITTATLTAHSILIRDSAVSDWVPFYADNVMAIDLDAHGLASATVEDMDKLTASYFEGVKSVTAPRVKSVGKNMFDNANIWLPGKLSLISGGVTDVNNTSNINYYNDVLEFTTLLAFRGVVSIFIDVAPNTSYTYNSITTEGSVIAQYLIHAYYDKDKNFISGVNGYKTSRTFLTPPNCKYIRVYIEKLGSAAGIANIKNLQLEVGTVATSYEPYKESFLYPEPKTLQRLPNGVCDTIENGNYIQRVKEYTLQASDISLYTSYVNVDAVLIKFPLDYVGINGFPGNIYFPEGPVYKAFLDTTDNINTIFLASATQFGIVCAKGTYANVTAARVVYTETKIYCQLANPIVTENVTSGILLSYPSGSIILEPALADAGVYTDKMSILQTAFPISSLESIKKINAITGEDTPLDVSLAVINADKLSFTHPNLALNDIVFFTYFYPETGCYGSNSFSYFDSRYVKVDSETGKYYKIDFSIADGVPSFNLVEVV